jgi:hypothetical protein
VRIERYIRERYLWIPVHEARIGAAGRVSVTVPARAHGIRFRAHLLRAKGGWGEGKSTTATLP